MDIPEIVKLIYKDSYDMRVQVKDIKKIASTLYKDISALEINIRLYHPDKDLWEPITVQWQFSDLTRFMANDSIQIPNDLRNKFDSFMEWNDQWSKAQIAAVLNELKKLEL